MPGVSCATPSSSVGCTSSACKALKQFPPSCALTPLLQHWGEKKKKGRKFFFSSRWIPKATQTHSHRCFITSPAQAARNWDTSGPPFYSAQVRTDELHQLWQEGEVFWSIQGVQNRDTTELGEVYPHTQQGLSVTSLSCTTQIQKHSVEISKLILHNINSEPARHISSGSTLNYFWTKTGPGSTAAMSTWHCAWTNKSCRTSLTPDRASTDICIHGRVNPQLR